MTIFMFKVICITNRHLCSEDFLVHITKTAAAAPDSIVLREKDLGEDDYVWLAEKLMNICSEYKVAFTMHFYYKAAIRLGIRRVHIPLFMMRQMTDEEKQFFSVIGVSCHSKEEAMEAEKLGASYITAGHIFETDCKAGLRGRGLGFLSEVKKSVGIPVFAIGGISPVNAGEVISAGADGICIMSGFMRAEEPSELLDSLRILKRGDSIS